MGKSLEKLSCLYMTAYFAALIVFLFWPVGLSWAIVNKYILSSDKTNALGICRYCGSPGRIIDTTYLSAAGLGFLWATLAALYLYIPKFRNAFFAPAAHRIKLKHVQVLMIVSVLIAILLTGALLLSRPPG